MSRWAYVNGQFVRHGEASVHIEDRGYQLADGIYEVWAVFDGKLADTEGHFARLERSRGELRHAIQKGHRGVKSPASLCRFLRTAAWCAAIESRATAARQR